MQAFKAQWIFNLQTLLEVKLADIQLPVILNHPVQCAQDPHVYAVYWRVFIPPYFSTAWE